jgi:YbbR domain-containing protein
MRWLVRNWHLKLAAVLLATVLYTGLVFSGSFSDGTLQVRIAQENVSSDTYVLSGDLGFVDIEYRTATDASPAVVEDSFRARVDMSQYDMERAPEPQELPVVVTPSDGIQILSIDPSTVRVELDRVETRSVPIEVDYGDVPAGLDVDDPVLDVEEVEVRGPASIVNRVDRVMAPVTIPASGIDVNEPVGLVPVDVTGQPIEQGPVDVTPPAVTVRIDVSVVQTTATVTVRPVIEGLPAPGYLLEGISVEPSTVTLRGLDDVLSQVTSVTTETLSLEDVSSDQTLEAELNVPDDTSVVGGAETVTVTVTIVPSVSGATFNLGVTCQGFGANACLPGIQQVAVTIGGTGDVLAALADTELSAIVDVSGLEPGTHSVEPVIGGLPDGFEIRGISPTTVPITLVAPAPQPTPAPTPAP